MDFKIIRSDTVDGLNEKIRTNMENGWIPTGSHQAVEKSHQLQYRGTQHYYTKIELEYSVSMTRETKEVLE